MFRFACLFNLLVRVLFETSHWNTRFIKCVVICPIWTCFARKHPYNAQAIDYIRDATWFKNYYILLQEYFHIYKMFLQTFEYFRETLQISSSDLLLKFILLLVREIYKIMQRNKRRMHEIYIYIYVVSGVYRNVIFNCFATEKKQNLYEYLKSCHGSELSRLQSQSNKLT